MKAWVVCFVVLFGLAELVLWSKDFFLPLPMYLLGGAFLAIASNSSKGLGGSFSQAGHDGPTHAAIGDRAMADKAPKPSPQLAPAETIGELDTKGK